MSAPIEDYKISQEIKALEYINDALDELGIPRDIGITRQTYTTWGRVSILIERYKSLENHMAHMAAPDAAWIAKRAHSQRRARGKAGSVSIPPPGPGR